MIVKLYIIHLIDHHCLFEALFDCRSNVSWALGDTALVIVELDTLRIIHSIPSAVRRGAVKNASSPELSRVFADLKRGIVAEGIAESIEVFTLEGRRIPLHGSGKLFLPGGTYVVRTREGNGGAMIGRLTFEKPGL